MKRRCEKTYSIPGIFWEIIQVNPQAQPKFLWGSVETVDNSVEKEPELWITWCFCLFISISRVDNPVDWLGNRGKNRAA